MFKQELPGGVHPSGLIVLAGLFVVGYFFWMNRPETSSAYTTEDIGEGQSIKPPGWNGEAFIFDDPSDNTMQTSHFRRVVFSREPAYHQPVVVQSGKKTPWYKFIDLTTYAQRKPFLEKRSF